MDATMIGGIVRALLATFGGGMMATGVVGESEMNVIIGAVATLAATAWSVYQKYRAKKA